MSSEASRTGYGPDAVAFRNGGPPGQEHSEWGAFERRVLLTKLHELEQRARRLEYLETRLSDLNHEVQLLTRLAEATQTMHAASDLPQLLDKALAHSVDILQANNGSILFYEAETDDLVLARVHGPCPPSLVGQRMPVGQGIAGYVALRRQPLLVADIGKDGRFPVRDSGRYATGSFISVPVQSEGQLLAILSVADRRDLKPFSANDLQTAVRLASDLASAFQRVRRMEASQDLHRQFVSKLAHELRNPLDGVLRFINLTLADQHPEDRRQRYLLASKQGLERLTGIVNSLTGFYRYARPSEDPVAVKDLLLQALQLQEGKAEQRGIRVSIDLEEGLPPIPGGNGLFQVFTNLVSNAYDAMEERGGTLAIAACRQGDAVVIRFSDTGCGMPPEVIERIFVPFFTTKQPGKGMGLGLAVCREIVSRLRGRMDVTSEPGRGTTFTVCVPCTRMQDAVKL